MQLHAVNKLHKDSTAQNKAAQRQLIGITKLHKASKLQASMCPGGSALHLAGSPCAAFAKEDAARKALPRGALPRAAQTLSAESSPWGRGVACQAGHLLLVQ